MLSEVGGSIVIQPFMDSLSKAANFAISAWAAARAAAAFASAAVDPVDGLAEAAAGFAGDIFFFAADAFGLATDNMGLSMLATPVVSARAVTAPNETSAAVVVDANHHGAR
jgi:hypothetical protein